MRDATDCPTQRDDDTAARWSARTLQPDEAARFEEHLLTCPTCQAAVRESAVIRGALVDHPPRARRWALPIAIAAGLAFAILRPGDPLDMVASLGDAPRFDGMPVRVSAEGAASMTNRGMDRYQAGDYRGAAVFLDSAWRADPSTAVAFYLGASLLWSGAERESIDVLRRVQSDALSPYAGDAALLLAKAYLRLREPDSSLAILTASPHATTVPGRALADSIGEVMRR